MISKSYCQWLTSHGASTWVKCISGNSKELNMCVFTLFQVSLLTIITIAFDRYLAVSKPFQVMNNGRVKYLKVIIPIIWLVGIILTIPMYVAFLDYSTENPFDDNPKAMAIMGAVFFPSSYLIPAIILIGTYIRIVWILKHRQLRVGSSSNQNTTLRTQQRASKLLGAVIVAHNVCFFPYSVITFAASQSLSSKAIINPTSYFVVYYIQLVSPALNPAIYFFHSQVFRNACKAIFIGKKKT